MISQVTTKSATIDQDGYRVLKVLGTGNSPLTADDCAPFGVDSSAVRNLVAIYAETEEAGDTVLIGYLNKNVLAAPGEIRLFSLDPATGNVSTFLWLHNNGQTDIGGTGDKLVRYTPLNGGLQELITAINGQLVAIAAGIVMAGGEYTPDPVTLNITDSKITTLNCSEV